MFAEEQTVFVLFCLLSLVSRVLCSDKVCFPQLEAESHRTLQQHQQKLRLDFSLPKYCRETQMSQLSQTTPLFNSQWYLTHLRFTCVSNFRSVSKTSHPLCWQDMVHQTAALPAPSTACWAELLNLAYHSPSEGKCAIPGAGSQHWALQMCLSSLSFTGMEAAFLCLSPNINFWTSACHAEPSQLFGLIAAEFIVC